MIVGAVKFFIYAIYNILFRFTIAVYIGVVI